MRDETYKTPANAFPVGPDEDFERLRHKVEAEAVTAPVLVQLYSGQAFTVAKGASSDQIQKQYEAIVSAT